MLRRGSETSSLTMALRTAEVLFKDRRASTLSETAGGGTRFAYGPDWAEDIACCLPAIRREHEWPRGLHPVFEHLGPEGWLRERQARVAHVVADDDLGLLLRYGADCIGAISMRPPPGAGPTGLITEATASPGRTVSGIQKKLLVSRAGPKTRFEPAAAEGPALHIAKFNSERLSTLVRNEALSLRWTAAVLGAGEVNAFETAFIPAVDDVAQPDLLQERRIVDGGAAGDLQQAGRDTPGVPEQEEPDPVPDPAPDQASRSFLLLFFKKEALPCFLPTGPRHAA